jgi:hypothetical protein
VINECASGDEGDGSHDDTTSPLPAASAPVLKEGADRSFWEESEANWDLEIAPDHIQTRACNAPEEGVYIHGRSYHTADKRSISSHRFPLSDDALDQEVNGRTAQRVSRATNTLRPSLPGAFEDMSDVTLVATVTTQPRLEMLSTSESHPAIPSTVIGQVQIPADAAVSPILSRASTQRSVLLSPSPPFDTDVKHHPNPASPPALARHQSAADDVWWREVQDRTGGRAAPWTEHCVYWYDDGGYDGPTSLAQIGAYDRASPRSYIVEPLSSDVYDSAPRMSP